MVPKEAPTLTANTAVVIFQRVAFRMGVQEDLGIFVLDRDDVIVSNLCMKVRISLCILSRGLSDLGCSSTSHYSGGSPGNEGS